MTRNWNGFWIGSGAGGLAIFLFVAAFFRSSGKVQNKEAQPAIADAIQ